MAGIKRGGIKKGSGYKKATVSSPAKKKAAYIKKRAKSTRTISNTSRSKAAAGSFKKPNGAAGRPLSTKFKALSITQDKDQKIQSF